MLPERWVRARDPETGKMGVWGMPRPRKPDAVRRREGYAGHSRPPEPEPEPPPYEGGPPKHLEGVARAQWVRVSALLKELDILTEADTETLEVYCVAYAAFRKATDMLKRGQVIKTPFGQQRSPWAAVQKDNWTMMEKAGSKLGLSPVDRTRLGNPDAGKKNKSKEKGDDEFFGAPASEPRRRPEATA